MTQIKAYDKYSLTLDYGSGTFDTSSFTDEENAVQIFHSFTGIGAFYYPSLKAHFILVA